mmetsp:Transcript_49286/g.119500  ORF Transcript_49286/g.119500 Transcript_49286/m.119500 type:complete len:406 (-) Transcript_49286:74-1291(-)
MVYQSDNGNDGDYDCKSGSLPIVHVVFDTDADFQVARSKELRTMIDDWKQNDSDDNNRRPNPYIFPHKDGGPKALRNIIKMWHSQDRVWNLMEDGWEEKRQKETDPNNDDKDNDSIAENSSAEYNDNHYDRVMMLRLDVVYVTPIDIWRSRRDYNFETIRTDGKGHLRRVNYTTGNNDPYFIDRDDNLSALIPGFAMYPVNDRMISGPYHAVKVWASERFERAESHVMETRMTIKGDQGDNNHTTVATAATTTREIIVPPKIPVGKGLHDETLVAKTLLPVIINEHNISVHVDPDLWFMRVRADGSIWILDTPNLNRYTAKLGDELLEFERQKLETVFQTYYDMLRQYKCHSDGSTKGIQRLEISSDGKFSFCEDVYDVRTEGVSSAAAYQIKCPPLHSVSNPGL